jgi:DNA primase
VSGAHTSASGEVIFTFDPDEAGQRAASRAYAEEQRFSAQTFVAVAPDGLDPCDLRLNRGDDAVRRLVETKRPLFEFMIRRVIDEFDLETVEGRAGAVRAGAPVLATMREQSLQRGYARMLAKWVGVDTDEVVAAYQEVARTTASQTSIERAKPQNAGDGPQSITSLPPLPDEPAGPTLMTLPSDLTTRTERDALMAMLQQPAAVGLTLMQRASQARLENTALAVVRDAIGVSLDRLEASDWLDVVLDHTPAPYDVLARELAVAPIPERENREITTYCRGIVSSLVERDILREQAEAMGQLRRTDAKQDPERLREIQLRIVALEQERRSVRQE